MCADSRLEDWSSRRSAEPRGQQARCRTQ
jgi:hypothetical protein